MMISLKGKDKAQVLMLLFNAARAQGLGLFQSHATPMTIKKARELVAKTSSFDYVQGRVLKIDLSGDKLDPFLYDRDNGQGAAARALGDGEFRSVPADPDPAYAEYNRIREQAGLLPLQG